MKTVLAVIAMLACMAAAWFSARAGISRLLSTSATRAASLDVANTAVRLTPSDPEAHRSRGAILRYQGQLAEAEQEYETAVSLRSTDDIIWLELGIVRDEMEDAVGAIAAMNEAVRTAPYYAHPYWQRGNVLLRQARYDEAFDDLRRAAKSNPDLQPNLIDLTWGISQGDPKLMEQILQIDDNHMRVLFARFLARKGRGREALEQLRLAHDVNEQARKEIVVNLLARKAYKEAFEIWSGRISDSENPGPLVIYDGGFESSLRLDEAGFGWRVAQIDSQSFSIDATQKQTGTKSLKIQFNGNSNPATPIVSQLVPVEPNKRYRLNASARTQDLVTGGPPILSVNAANTELLLGKSASFKSGTNEWFGVSFEFTSGADTNAVLVSLKRENCASSPCPIFGVIWLDSFSMEEIKSQR
jgi:tetratricopeptide (TPR) repeat protein